MIRSRRSMIFLCYLISLLYLSHCLIRGESIEVQNQPQQVEVAAPDPSATREGAALAPAPETPVSPLPQPVTATSETTESTSSSSEAQDSVVDEKDLAVVDITARNFAHLMSDGHAWLIEFYSPRCSHCVSFAPSYADLARELHLSISTWNVRVGRINSDEEPSLASRFDIKVHPSFFVVDGFSVYPFEDQHRSKSTILAFAKGGYKKAERLPFLHSPMGPLGLMQGTFISSGFFLADTFLWIRDSYGFSTMVTGTIMFATMFMGVFVLILVLALAATPREKRD